MFLFSDFKFELTDDVNIKFVVSKDRKIFCSDLKKVYTAPNAKTALEELEVFKIKWQSKYKYAIASWEENWPNLSNYFEYPIELRKIIYIARI